MSNNKQEEVNKETRFPEDEEVIRILDLLRERLPELTEKHSVKSLGVFGSYTRNEQGPQSDLDLLVEFYEPPSLFEFIRLEDQLSDWLNVQVDLVMRDTLKPEIGKHILQEVVPV
jgi:predicted nucleotidyltransferase